MNAELSPNVCILNGPGAVQARNNQHYSEILGYNGIDHDQIEVTGIDPNEIIDRFSHCIYYYSHRDINLQCAATILPLLEYHGGLRCFPSYSERWHFDNKIAQTYLAQEKGFPLIQTWIFWDYEEARTFVENTVYPLVVKLSLGAGSGNVVKIDSRRAAKRILERSFFSTIHSSGTFATNMREHALSTIESIKRRLKGAVHHRNFRPEYWRESSQYVLFQRFLPDNRFDTRITVVADRAFAFRRMNRPGDFRASGSGMIDYSPSEIDTRLLTIGFQMADTLGTSSLAIDFLFDENNEPRIGEFGYRYATEALRNCPGAWKRDLSWIENDKSPEHLHLESLLDRPLRIPRGRVSDRQSSS